MAALLVYGFGLVVTKEYTMDNQMVGYLVVLMAELLVTLLADSTVVNLIS